MIRTRTLDSPARPPRRSVPAAARGLAAVAGLAVSLAAAAVPALAAQHPGGLAASQTCAGVIGQHMATGGMSPGAPWVHIAAGIYYTCATRTDGTVWCWGYNGQGQAGIGNESNQDLPRQVTTPARGGWASVTAGGEHICATRAGGTLWCWGKDDFGELGIGGDADQDLPRQVTG